jgi:KaiC/GvpD/RAD55 family RecA-like ATPase
MSDYSWRQLTETMLAFNWPVEEYVGKDRIYRIDTISRLGSRVPKETETLKISQTENPTDVMLNVSSGTKFLYKKFNRFRAIMDSTTSFYLYNPPQLINRVLKSFIQNIKDAGGTAIITYAEGSVDNQTETMLKACVDNLIYLDGKVIEIEAMMGLGKAKANYIIGENGIEIKENSDPKSFVACGLN